jgi:hypothetical protein
LLSCCQLPYFFLCPGFTSFLSPAYPMLLIPQASPHTHCSISRALWEPSWSLLGLPGICKTAEPHLGYTSVDWVPTSQASLHQCEYFHWSWPLSTLLQSCWLLFDSQVLWIVIVKANPLSLPGFLPKTVISEYQRLTFMQHLPYAGTVLSTAWRLAHFSHISSLWANWGLEKLGHLHKVTQLVGGRARIQTHDCLTPEPVTWT